MRLLASKRKPRSTVANFNATRRSAIRDSTMCGTWWTSSSPRTRRCACSSTAGSPYLPIWLLDRASQSGNLRVDLRDRVTMIMVMSDVLPLAEVKAKFSEMVDRVEQQHDRILSLIHI